MSDAVALSDADTQKAYRAVVADYAIAVEHMSEGAALAEYTHKGLQILVMDVKVALTQLSPSTVSEKQLGFQEGGANTVAV